MLLKKVNMCCFLLTRLSFRCGSPAAPAIPLSATGPFQNLTTLIWVLGWTTKFYGFYKFLRLYSGAKKMDMTGGDIGQLCNEQFKRTRQSHFVGPSFLLCPFLSRLGPIAQ